MRTPRHGIALATVGTSVFALDGSVIPSHSQSSTVAEVLPFTAPAASAPAASAPGASPWQAVHEAPTARQEVAVTSDNGVIWVFGGLTGRTSTAKVEGYDPAIDTWKSGPDLPLPLHHAMAVTFHGELVVMGGWVPQGDNLSAVTSNRVFALRNGAWVELPPLNRPRAAGAAAVVGDRIVVVGGQGNGQLVRQTELFDGTHWSDGPDMPTPRDHLAAASDGQYVYAIGGRVLSADKNLGSFERFDVAARSWARGPDLPTPRGGIGATFVNGEVVVAGGETPTSVLDTVEAFELATGKWKALPALRTARHGAGVAAVGPSLYVIDGGRRPGNGDPSPVTEVLRL
jgi:non-specific serine/threonine protein kinase